MYFNTKQELKRGILTKRALGRRRLGTINWKDRLFILTVESLAYYDEKQPVLKNSISIANVKAVENLDEGSFDKQWCFQVQYEDFILYISAPSDKIRDEWVQALREVCTSNKCLVQNFHSGIFSGFWTCCKEKDQKCQGCKVTTTNLVRKPPYPPPNQEIFRVVAKFKYTAVQPGDLQLIKGDEYIILNSTQLNWWLARDQSGNQGYIPSNYVARNDAIESQSWFHGDMSRQEADNVLKDPTVGDGTFLVRNSSRPTAYPYTLSLSFQGVAKHYHINKDAGGQFFVSDRHRFDSVAKLIEYHKFNSAGLVVRLRFEFNPLNDNAPVELGSGVFEIKRSDLTIKRQIGTGQFGSVHEALHQKKTPVAVKMMKQGSMSEHDFIEEARVMIAFKHKHLVSLYGVCSKDQPLLIVMELLPMGSLLEYLRKRKDLLSRPAILTDMALQVASAMKYLEEMKFIHRDLAARNCLVGDQNLVKVGDFGLARYVLDDQYTASEGTKFPVKWAAPEVIEYTNFSSKSDVWAFGILCWEIFTGGKSPYAGLTNPQVADEVRRGYRLEQPQHCPGEVFRIMARCWDKRPDARPPFRDVFGLLQVVTEESFSEANGNV